MREWKLFANDMFEAVEAIERFTEGKDQASFVADDLVFSAVIQKIEILGEAARHIPQDIQEIHSEVIWYRMTDMRNRLAHGYFQIDGELVWKAIKDDLPTLKAALSKLIV